MILLKRNDVKADSRDGDGRTPLSYAAQWGRKAVAKFLLEREDVNPESHDENGKTPVDWARLRLPWNTPGEIEEKKVIEQLIQEK
jgi:hypothetical protein